MHMEELVRRPLSDFTEHAADWVEELRQTERPVVLTVDDTMSIVMQDATSYGRMVERLEELETRQAIQAGLDDIAAGRTLPLADAMEQLRAKFDL